MIHSPRYQPLLATSANKRSEDLAAPAARLIGAERPAADVSESSDVRPTRVNSKSPTSVCNPSYDDD